MLTVVEYYVPWWSEKQLKRPVAFRNRDAAVKSAMQWASELAIEKFGDVDCQQFNSDKDTEFVVTYENWVGTQRCEVALLFDVSVS